MIRFNSRELGALSESILMEKCRQGRREGSDCGINEYRIIQVIFVRSLSGKRETRLELDTGKDSWKNFKFQRPLCFSDYKNMLIKIKSDSRAGGPGL